MYIRIFTLTHIKCCGYYYLVRPRNTSYCESVSDRMWVYHSFVSLDQHISLQSGYRGARDQEDLLFIWPWSHLMGQMESRTETRTWPCLWPLTCKGQWKFRPSPQPRTSVSAIESNIVVVHVCMCTWVCTYVYMLCACMCEYGCKRWRTNTRSW